jgi:hypothetical protein
MMEQEPELFLEINPTYWYGENYCQLLRFKHNGKEYIMNYQEANDYFKALGIQSEICGSEYYVVVDQRVNHFEIIEKQ